MASKTQATGGVLPPGTLPLVEIQATPSLTLTIDSIQTEQSFGDPVQTAPLDVPMVKVIYSDGFIKHHEAADAANLMGKIQNTLKGRYGVTGYDIAALAFEPGAIELENVTYGK